MEEPKSEKVEDMTSEKLALLLNQQYVVILQAQQNIDQSKNNIGIINKELEKRSEKEEKNGKEKISSPDRERKKTNR